MECALAAANKESANPRIYKTKDQINKKIFRILKNLNRTAPPVSSANISAHCSSVDNGVNAVAAALAIEASPAPFWE